MKPFLRESHYKDDIDTVDGSEIRRSPVDMANIPLFAGFYTSQVQDFFHQQYKLNVGARLEEETST